MPSVVRGMYRTQLQNLAEAVKKQAGGSAR
jgi:hypothetical protein